jgi:hypothetical protein
MSKTILSVALSAMLFALCFPAEAQQTKKVARIGLLSAVDRVSDVSRVERQFGWRFGRRAI